MGDFILNLLNSPAFQMLATTFLASVAVDSTIAGIKQVKDAIKNKPHESQLLDSLEMAFFATEKELGWKHDTEAIYESFFGSLLSFTGSFTRGSLARIFIEAVKTEVTEEEINVWITNILKQLSLPNHTDLREFLKLSHILDEDSEPSSVSVKYILTPNSSVCENEDIIGRDSLIDNLLKMLESKNSRIQIAGMGGLGKTETLNKLYARLAKNREIASFEHIGLIRFSGEILSDIQAQVNCPPEYLGLQGVEAAKRYLQDTCQEKKVLLCMDDIRKEQPLLEESNSSIEFLRSLGASILLAARASFPGFEVHDLEFLPIDECIQIFERQYGRSITDGKEREILEGIIKNRAGNHTMVVNRLGSMAKIYNWTIPVLSEKLEEKNFNFAKSINDDELLQREINKLYQINDTLNEAEKNLLEAFSVFPATPLPVELCVEWLHEDAGVDEDTCARLLNKLAEQTWLVKRCSGDNCDVSFLMHLLVRAAVQEQVETQYAAHQQLTKNCTISLGTSTENYNLMKSSLIAPIAISVFQNLFQGNQSISALAFNIAEYYNTTASNESALEWYMKDLTISEKVFGKDHPNTAITYDSIAIIYTEQGKCELALEWNQKALTIREKILGKDHPDTARTYSNLANIYLKLGNFDLALEWFEKALAIFEIKLDGDHPDIARTYGNIANVYFCQGKYDLALEWHQKALSIFEKILGKEHPSTASSYNNIANVYEYQDKYVLALVWYQKALTIFEKIFGKDHPNTTRTYKNIADVYTLQGKYDLALEWYQKALGIFEKILGKDHLSTADIYNKIAIVYQIQDKYDLALGLYLKVLAIREKLLGKDHLDTANTYYLIGSTYKAQGKYSLAFKWLKKALPIFEMRLGSRNHQTIMTRETMEKVQNIISSNLWNS